MIQYWRRSYESILAIIGFIDTRQDDGTCEVVVQTSIPCTGEHITITSDLSKFRYITARSNTTDILGYATILSDYERVHNIINFDNYTIQIDTVSCTIRTDNNDDIIIELPVPITPDEYFNASLTFDLPMTFEELTEIVALDCPRGYSLVMYDY